MVHRYIYVCINSITKVFYIMWAPKDPGYKKRLTRDLTVNLVILKTFQQLNFPILSGGKYSYTVNRIATVRQIFLKLRWNSIDISNEMIDMLSWKYLTNRQLYGPFILQQKQSIISLDIWNIFNEELSNTLFDINFHFRLLSISNKML